MCLPPPEHEGQGCDAMDLFFEIEERKIVMSESEYINKELKEHPEPGYLSDLRILRWIYLRRELRLSGIQRPSVSTAAGRYPQTYNANV